MSSRTYSLRFASRGLIVEALAVGCWALLCLWAATAQAQAESVDRGQVLFESRCVACHSLDANRTGPALRSVVGRAAGKAEGYFYSDAMAAATHVWSVEKLKAWLTNPQDVVPGQEMNFRVDLPQDREDVVAYLASLSEAQKK
jgi:cytochrome c